MFLFHVVLLQREACKQSEDFAQSHWVHQPFAGSSDPMWSDADAGKLCYYSRSFDFWGGMGVIVVSKHVSECSML